MACEKREREGSCNHSQCPFPDKSGYECVEIVGGYCEVGLGCVKECPYSYQGKRKNKFATQAFEAKYPELRQ